MDALLVGYYEGDKLRFAGKVRAELVAHSRRELATKLKPLATQTVRSAICQRTARHDGEVASLSRRCAKCDGQCRIGL